MKNFYKLLFTTLKDQDQYLEMLALITQASRSQMDSMASDLAWQSWDAQMANPSNVQSQTTMGWPGEFSWPVPFGANHGHLSINH